MPVKHPPCNPEIWGGIECTITRIGDTYRDQLSLSGHYSRSSDIDELADLGIRTIRYPLLWERQQPDLATAIDWSWPDTRLAALRDRQMTPIVGLLHHGSGPAFTQLDDPGFAEHFAAYAGAVAARYPWIENYTPINEPLTTARFCGLYGLWHPHQRSAVEFLNMMLNQMKGIVAAMKAIRKINPAAKLVQTEDLAKTHSKPSLAYQADFENQRRWLTFDILCGKVDPSHPLWEYLLYAGIEADRLFYFVENPCIPDILGINYYVTSERYLDDEVQQYACETHGGNGRHAYADVEAVRVFEQDGLSVLLRELDDRYDLPIALTEVHLNCTREEQVRWLYQAWTTACAASRDGLKIVAVTAWALLGAYDWDSLLTRPDGHYESGAYAIVNNELRITAVGYLVRALAKGIAPGHPLLKMPGWWNKDPANALSVEPLLLYYREKQSGRMLAEICRYRGIACRLISLSEPLTERVIAIDLLLHNAWGFFELKEHKTDRPDRAELGRQLDLFIDNALANDCLLSNVRRYRSMDRQGQSLIVNSYKRNYGQE